MYRLKIMSSHVYANLTFRTFNLEENKPVNYMSNRQDIYRSIKLLEQKVVSICRYCQRCYNCIKFHTHHNELSKNSFHTFNKNVIYWDVRDPDFNPKNSTYEIRPVYKIED